MNICKPIGIITFSLASLSLLAWPILGYLSIFLFDAPLADDLDGHLRYLSVLLVLSYPVGYVVALPWFITKWRRGQLKLRHSLSGLIPLVHLVVAFWVSGLIMKYQHERQNPNIALSERVIIEDRGRDRYVASNTGDILVDRHICAYHMLADKSMLIVAQNEVREELIGGTVFEVNSADDRITYFAVNIVDGSVSGGYSINEIKETFRLPDELELFEPEARRDEFIKNNPDIHGIHDRKRMENRSGGAEPTVKKSEEQSMGAGMEAKRVQPIALRFATRSRRAVR